MCSFYSLQHVNFVKNKIYWVLMSISNMYIGDQVTHKDGSLYDKDLNFIL